MSGAVRFRDGILLGAETVPLTATPSGGGGAAFSGVRLRRATAQSIANTTTTAIAFDVEDYDVGGYHDTAVNPSRITVATAGYYSVGATLHYAANTAGDRYLQIRKNGTDRIAGSATRAIADATLTTALSCAIEIQLAAADYLEVTVYQTSGGAVDVTASELRSPVFYLSRLGTL